ncbi:Tubby-like F-box protein 10 [Acorus gramineus]|uniref:Tubby-like F-box protein 10 n=1 Tax=Acorus gramineus TaxID=55184 RepID=A0AAV9BAU5_ACOGR|nr:Tubby-like F-box protein 10 [Acorus gramineus]
MMQLKSIVRDGIGSLSRRGRSRRKSVEEEGPLSFDGGEEAEGGKCWARLSPDSSTKLTFPISLKQPGPRSSSIQCYIKRNKATLTYHLYLGLDTEKGKFLLAAKKTRRPTHAEYVISLVADDVSPNSVNYMGKLRSNFLGTKFTIYDNQPPCTRAVTSTARSSRQFHSRKVSPKVPSCSYEIAHIAYELNMLKTRGPRRMWCTMHSIPSTALEPNGSVPCHNDDNPLHSLEDPFSSLSLFEESKFDGPLIMKNQAPRWHEHLQCYCLNFHGRVTIGSVKNFQLIAASEEEQATTITTSSKTMSQSSKHIDPEKIILQFGRIGKDLFTMDYRYPLSAFEAFGICLSSFDTKLACE